MNPSQLLPLQEISLPQLRQLGLKESPASVTILMPLHRTFPGNGTDPVLYRDLVDQAEDELLRQYGESPEVVQTLAQLRELQAEGDFWKQTHAEGLAALASPKFLQLYRLSFAPAATVDVGELFRLTPLTYSCNRNLQFHLLALSPKKTRLYRCTRDKMVAVALPEHVPTGVQDITGGVQFNPVTRVHTAAGFGIPGSFTSIASGHSDPREDRRQVLIDYYRILGRGIRRLLAADELPLVVAAVSADQTLFRDACPAANLLEEGVIGSPDELTEQEMQAQAIPLVEAWNLREQDRDREQFENLGGTVRASHALAEILTAAHAGRVDVLFVPLKKRYWGLFSPATGILQEHPIAEPGDHDLTELAVRQTLRHRGTVHVLPDQEAIPGDGPLAAILRW